MGLITQAMSLIFGGGGSRGNAITDIAGVFMENSENAAVREAAGKAAALQQFAAEFQHQRRGLFDRFVDGVNRLPRPMLALGTIALFVSAMYEPDWFASRMVGIALIPEPLWWLMGAIVSFYFGSRHQAKGQEFQRSVVESIAMNAGRQAAAPEAAKVAAPSEPKMRDIAEPEPDTRDDNPALAAWQAAHAN